MDWGILLAILFFFAFLTPMIQRTLTNSRRLRAIRELEQKRNSRVITLIHRQESISFLGVPITRFINVDDSEAVLRAIRLTPPDLPIDMIVHTPGGLVLAAEQIARALIRHRGHVTVFVPHYAMSGGTLIAMAADTIVMDENAVLGPVDPQIGQYPAASILSVIEQKPVNEIDDQTLVLADIARKAMSQVHDTVVDILIGNHRDRDQAKRIAETLSRGKWTHDYPIQFDEAHILGLPVATGVPVEVYQLMDLYPQTAQRRPSVEYVPVPYQPSPAQRGRRDRPGDAE